MGIYYVLFGKIIELMSFAHCIPKKMELILVKHQFQSNMANHGPKTLYVFLILIPISIKTIVVFGLLKSFAISIQEINYCGIIDFEYVAHNPCIPL
jgi:hypothetical protein